jgi:hypothetical protein
MPNPTSIAAGHLDATRKGIKSTKPKTKMEDIIPEPSAEEILLSKDKRLWYQVYDVTSATTGRTHADATGAFPVKSLSGALYVIVYYHEDYNYIHVETTKSRTGVHLLEALQKAVRFFERHGAKPQLVRMDNECSQLTKDW